MTLHATSGGAHSGSRPMCYIWLMCRIQSCVQALWRCSLSPAQHLARCSPPKLHYQAVHSLQLCMASCLQAEAARTSCRACTNLLPAVASLSLTLRFVLVLLLPLATTCPSATKTHLNTSKEVPQHTTWLPCNWCQQRSRYCPQAHPMGTSSSARACLACRQHQQILQELCLPAPVTIPPQLLAA